LATTIDARVHCAVLKIRAVPQRTTPHPRRRRSGPMRMAIARSLRTQQRARPVHHRHHPSVPKDVLTGFTDELTK